MKKKINIAIDGYSACGKGTMAKMLSRALHYTFIDTGAMYRAVALNMLQNGIKMDQTSRLIKSLDSIQIEFKHNPELDYYHTLLNGKDVESEIRTPEINAVVSPVSAIPEIRAFLVAQQQEIGKHKGIVMDGRDIGTVVFPDAELKIFMTAKPDVRATRRYNEMISQGMHALSFQEILENINQRDRLDSNRENSPLIPAKDAFILDNSDMTREQQFEIAFQMAMNLINGKETKNSNH